MYVYLGPDTFAGHPWPADEIAKGLVAELNLRKGDTVTKNQIIEYMAKFGLGPLWATDVAMVLRNVFGVTPIFYESQDGQNTSLLEELQGIVSEDEEVDFDFTENDLAIAESKAIEEAFAEAKTEEEEAIIAALSFESVDTVADIVALSEMLTPQELDEAAAAYMAGGDELVEDWYQLTFRPHLVRFMDEGRLNRLAEAIGTTGSELVEKVRSDIKQQRRQAMARELHNRARAQAQSQLGPDASVSALKKRTIGNLQRNMAAMDREDPLAQRAKDAAGGANLAMRYHMDKGAAGLQAAMAGRTSAQGRGQFKADALRRARERMAAAKANPAPLPKDVAPQPEPAPGPAPVSQAPAQQPGLIKRGLSALGRVAARAGKIVGKTALGVGGALGKAALGASGAIGKAAIGAAGAAASRMAPNQATSPDAPQGGDAGAGQQVAKGAKSVLGKIGGALSRVGGRASGVMRAKLRMRHPGLAHLLYGEPGDNERQAAQHMGLAHQYAQLGHELKGLDHQYQQAYLRGADRRYSNPYRQRLARNVPNNPRFAR